MVVRVSPSKLKGSVEAISSKSYAQRILLASALCRDKTRIYLNHISADILSTIKVAKSLGYRIDQRPGYLDVQRVQNVINPVVNCGESGTVARMVLPILTSKYESGTIKGEGSLLDRPFMDLTECISQRGVKFSANKLPIKFEHKGEAGRYFISGGVSSQYISGLMYGLPKLNGTSRIIMTKPLQSKGYVNMTIDVLKQFKVEVTPFRSSEYVIKGPQRYFSPGEITVEGDWSNAAFFHAAGINVTGLNTNSLQEDKRFLEVCNQDEIDVGDIPDLVPILAVYSAINRKPMKIVNAGRLKIKESNRLETVKDMLDGLTVEPSVTITDDEMIIDNKFPLRGGTVYSFNDHRIVMAACIAGAFCKEDVVIINAEAVKKSYPSFFKDYMKVGGKIDVISTGV